MKKKQSKNRGILTLDFIFSFLVMYGIAMVFALMAMTLMMSSVAQYITFATNRAHISGHVSEDLQRDMGVRKFESLVSSLGPFFGTNQQSYFRLQINLPQAPQDFSGNTANLVKYGFNVDYTATILRNARFPIIGGPGDGVNNSFGRATLKAYMYREPTTDECRAFNDARWEKIQQRFPNLNGSYISGSDAYGSSPDNGC